MIDYTMPATYKQVYNGHAMVMRKVQTKQKGNGVKAAMPEANKMHLSAAPAVKPAMKLDQKALRAKLSAELFKTL